MRPVLAWIDKIQDEDGTEHCIWDLDYKPDGSELLVAADTKVLVYDGTDGTLLQALKGHKDTVYCVVFSHNGERFASGSADKCVIIWTEQHEGTLKYNHGDAIQSLTFSPVSCVLLSCAISDFGLWTLSQKSVIKQKSPARVCSSSWAPNGKMYAIGMFNGTISVRSGTTNEELHRMDRPGGEPVWAIAFSPGNSEEGGVRNTMMQSEQDSIGNNYLAVTDWSQTLSFYDMEGNLIGKETELGYDPCDISYFSVGEFLVLAGSNKEVILHSREGTMLGSVCQMDSWIWVVKSKPRSQFVTIGCQDGTLACYQLLFSTVHGLHKERYAFRENMTDVVVQDLTKDLKVRIRCRDLVRKVAVYHHRLAIQLSDRVNVYRQVSGDREHEHLDYRIIERIQENFDCSLLVVCAQHLILCQEKRLQCYDFRGLKIREWLLDALIRYIKVIGGPAGRESILVGLKNGQVLKIFVDNPFPVELLQIKSAVRCLDISMTRCKLAIVDEHGTCVVYDLQNKELCFQEPNANSVAWNTDNEDLLCFSGNGALSIKAREFAAYQQRMQGFVVGFSGKRVFCLHMYAMSSIEVPLSNQLYQFLEKNLYKEAYELACLGATETDWQILAFGALHNLELLTAKKAFHRIRNFRFLELIHDIEERQKRGESDKNGFLADIFAYEGNFTESAKLYQEANKEQQALDMFTDLRMFEQAQELLSQASGETQKTLIRKRANWAENSNEPRVAVEMYISAGDFDKAVDLLIRNNWLDQMVTLARKLDKTHVEPLKRVAKYFVESKEYTLAAEIYGTLGDQKALVQMYVGAQLWDDAFALANSNPQFRDEVYVPYARWLAENDRFEEAQKAYHKAGRQQEALHVLEQLTENAVKESRFIDAGYYYWMLSVQYLDRANEDTKKEHEYIVKFKESQELAEIYYAYHAVHRYLAEPFTSYQPDALLNIARFILHQIGVQPPNRVSKVGVLYTLAKQGTVLGAYKLARHAYERLQKLKAPARFQQLIDLGSIQIRSKPFHDSEDMLPMCYRCSTPNPMLNSNGNLCLHCKTPFAFSFVSFDVLPLVEFVMQEGISDQEAKELIEAEPPLNEDAAHKNDPFTQRLTVEQSAYTPVKVDRATLLSLNKTEVTICEWPNPLKNQYYRNMIPEISVSKCGACNRLFHTDDYELAVLQEGHCPFCRTKSDHALRRGPGDDEDEEENE